MKKSNETLNGLTFTASYITLGNQNQVFKFVSCQYSNNSLLNVSRSKSDDEG